MLDNFIYSFGGQTATAKVLDDFIELNVITGAYSEVKIDNGANLIEPLHSMAICPVYYASKMFPNGVVGNLKLKSLSGRTNWGEAKELIKHEGFYMFGGRKKDGRATNDLIIFKVDEDPYTHKAAFNIIKPKTFGKQPPPRYCHSINFVQKLGFIVIYGGRNDEINAAPVLDDIWLIKV